MALNKAQLYRQETQQQKMLANMAVAMWRQNQHDAKNPQQCFTPQELLENAVQFLLTTQYKDAY